MFTLRTDTDRQTGLRAQTSLATEGRDEEIEGEREKHERKGKEKDSVCVCF